jgi:type IV pilus assembly protein PilM
MLFNSQSLGLEIGRDGLKFSLLSHRKDEFRLDAFAVAPLTHEMIRFSHREPIVLTPAPFVTQVRAAWHKLLTKRSRVSVSLPDACGRVMLLDLETRFRSHEEGAGIIRWKLKKHSSVDIQETHLDYQIIRQKDSGEQIALVSLIAKPVITQLEELLADAGLEPYAIDFTSFNLYRLFARRVEPTETSVLISCFGGCLGIMLFYDGILEYYRSKELPGGQFDAGRLFQEISSSLLMYREKNPLRELGSCFCIVARSQWEPLHDIVAEITGSEPILLDSEQFVQAGPGIALDNGAAFILSASLGAAVRAF